MLLLIFRMPLVLTRNIYSHRSLIFKWSWLINESNKPLYKAFSRLTGDRETILGPRYDHEAIRT